MRQITEASARSKKKRFIAAFDMSFAIVKIFCKKFPLLFPINICAFFNQFGSFHFKGFSRKTADKNLFALFNHERIRQLFLGSF